MEKIVPDIEIINRLDNFKREMDIKKPNWKVALIFSKVNQYYFTGTMQDGFLAISKEFGDRYFVRRSFKRAIMESGFKEIISANSLRILNEYYPVSIEEIYVETNKLTMDMASLIKRYYPNSILKSCDFAINNIREVKSLYEIDKIKKSGQIHKKVLEDIAPSLIYEGISEAKLAMKIYESLVDNGHHGIARFAMFDTEMMFGQIGFGENSSYPSYFNGPGGNKGISAAVPLFGSRERKLKKGDLIFIDIACGYDGYHTDKTITYVFGKKISSEAKIAHEKCLQIEKEIAKELKPGNIPEEIYQKIYSNLDKEFKDGFMGKGDRTVKFLGHGVGLMVDEYPVIAKKFTKPLKENMTIAVEPKKVVDNIGTLGVENTYIVTKDGGKCVTGESKGLIEI